MFRLVSDAIFCLSDVPLHIVNLKNPLGFIDRRGVGPAPSWVDSSIGRALHRYRRGHGFESRLSLNFFQAFFSQLLKLHI